MTPQDLRYLSTILIVAALAMFLADLRNLSLAWPGVALTAAAILCDLVAAAKEKTL